MPKTSSLSQVRDTVPKRVPTLYQGPSPAPRNPQILLGLADLNWVTAPWHKAATPVIARREGSSSLRQLTVGEGERERVSMDPDCGLRDLAFSPSLLWDPGLPPDPNLMKEVIKRGAR